MFYSLPLPLQHSKSGPESVNDMKRGGAICEQRHSLNKIVLSQSSHQRKQDALDHTLSALQIAYLSPFEQLVSIVGGSVVCVALQHTLPPRLPTWITSLVKKGRKSTRVLLAEERSKKVEALAVSPVQSVAHRCSING